MSSFSDSEKVGKRVGSWLEYYLTAEIIEYSILTWNKTVKIAFETYRKDFFLFMHVSFFCTLHHGICSGTANSSICYSNSFISSNLGTIYLLIYWKTISYESSYVEYEIRKSDFNGKPVCHIPFAFLPRVKFERLSFSQKSAQISLKKNYFSKKSGGLLVSKTWWAKRVTSIKQIQVQRL